MNMPIREPQQGFQTLIENSTMTNNILSQNALWKNVETLVSAKMDDLMNKVSIFDANAVINSVNNRWTSVYTNQMDSKKYLDSFFPLAEGSHKDVKSYVVYYHHLLAFFEDGQQSGLANPKQFVALCGHKCAPDSIVLKHNDLHTEIVINAKGDNGSKDLANIDNILTENGITTVVSFDKPDAIHFANADAYANLIALLTGQLKGDSCAHKSGEIAFTKVDGDDYILSTRTPIVIQGAGDIKAIFA